MIKCLNSEKFPWKDSGSGCCFSIRSDVDPDPHPFGSMRIRGKRLREKQSLPTNFEFFLQEIIFFKSGTKKNFISLSRPLLASSLSRSRSLQIHMADPEVTCASTGGHASPLHAHPPASKATKIHQVGCESGSSCIRIIFSGEGSYSKNLSDTDTTTSTIVGSRSAFLRSLYPGKITSDNTR